MTEGLLILLGVWAVFLLISYPEAVAIAAAVATVVLGGALLVLTPLRNERKP